MGVEISPGNSIAENGWKYHGIILTARLTLSDGKNMLRVISLSCWLKPIEQKMPRV